ncbi:hypothetical protein [Arthrobacter sp. A5]|uniref:hypothetical protein n=1 Tax=Arthrobacter sp. A5 TaxID=576926 RepID=UPI003DA90618
MAGLLPEKIELEVVTHLFADAERLKWTHMNLTERSRQYKEWLLDPRIGGTLCRFMASEEARVWIKDGPMKEFARAVHGQGKYGHLIARRAPSPEHIVRKALGDEWQVIPGSQKIKPLRVTAYGDDEEITFAWGPVRDYKHLVWAALSSLAGGETRSWVLCLTASFVNPTPRNVQAHNIRLAERCGLKVIHLSLTEG